MDRTIKTGLLAYGMSGKVFHAPFIAAHPGFELLAVTERHDKKAHTDYPEIKSYNTIEELLGDKNIELVIVNTPNFTHFDYAKKALLAGKHILVEKPFAATSSEAQELFELALDMGKKVFVYQNRRWDSDFLTVKKLIKEEILGKLNEVHFRFDRYRNAIGVKSFKEELVAATGLQYDLGPHLLDQVISVFGKPLSFYKVLGKNRENTKVDDYFSIHLKYPNDVNVFVHANMLVADVQPAFVLHGTNGSFVKNRADVQEDQLVKGVTPKDEEYGIEAPENEGLLTLVDSDGNKIQQKLSSEPANYLQLFESLYQAIVNEQPYPVKEQEIISQLEILSS
ncbi:Gfo/Idh/MocA family oxidoreductase [Pedobacter sp. MC2016-14]|uniref:Gfo/Idh/MocA family oxidoreductase n=1 Tax=Pedobacter sp. MC2016-14 TaxID=2897327 RepID=UPI001E5B8B51|nr:Gfo/Idh/MocA family oxidoreductase [Pedobacter sp. MC2016-14]MCD0487063.1 Gfo/Idh/MocA family oxidoreductase [Pedobacter sp. MC2016-14]